MAWHGYGTVFATTDADGCFVLGPLPPGEHVVATGPDSRFGFLFSRATPPRQRCVDLAAGERLSGLELCLPPRQSLSGRVLGPDGTPLGGVRVTAHSEFTPDAVATGVTDDRGHFTFARLRGASFDLVAQHQHYPATGADDVPGGAADVTLQFSAGATLAGAIVTSTGSAQWCRVAARPRDLPFRRWRLRLNLSDGVQSTVFGAPADFVLSPLPAGTHELAITTTGGETAVVTVTLREGEDRRDLVVTTAPGLTITGRVIQASTGAPARDASVEAQGPAGPRTQVDPQGTFVLCNVHRTDPVRVWVAAEGCQDRELLAPLPAQGTLLDLGTIALPDGTPRWRQPCS
jgi:hypothetical protein